MPSPAQHLNHIVNEIPVSNSELLPLSPFRQLSEIVKGCKLNTCFK